jgi:hypothetical protein
VNIRRPAIFAFLQKFRAAFSFFCGNAGFSGSPRFSPYIQVTRGNCQKNYGGILYESV